MEPRELLNSVVSFLASGRLLELHCDSSRLDTTPSGPGRSASGECRMEGGGLPVEGTPTHKSVKRGFGPRRCTVIMTYLVLGMCALYIILMGLPY